jgi:hypothetical protein
MPRTKTAAPEPRVRKGTCPRCGRPKPRRPSTRLGRRELYTEYGRAILAQYWPGRPNPRPEPPTP